ncbi:MAG TPA: DUF1207 domain-containing protein [Lacipirellulaceae bacterium]|nr:DUF1207 domain-containing protein [Lacipirellulaceae bacterium]
MILHRIRSSAWVALTAALLAAPRDGHAQSPSWQPYREPLTADAALASAAGASSAVASAPSAGAASVVQPAQAICDPAVMCPPGAMYAQPSFAAPTMGVPCYIDPSTGPPTSPAYWQWRSLPEGVIWQSYWAGAHEPRMSGTPFVDQNGNALLDVTLGGRASLLRYGTDGPGRPLGAELQIEGAAFPRLNLDENWDLEATDFRFGVPLVYGRERWEAKFSYYHLSSHMGDEFAIREMALAQRINYSRDALTLALAFYPLPAWRWYAEAGWAFHYDGGAEPWEFQFGVDVAEPGATDMWGTPFLSVNGHLREEHNYGGNLVFQAGWLWRGNSTRTLRLGFHYYNGKSNQFEFFDQFEEQLGGGLWYDF